jgi:DNA sulfur modification protein DndD
MLFSENSPWLLMGLDKQISAFSEGYKNYIIKLTEQRTILRLSEDPTMLLLPPNSPDKSSLLRMLEVEKCEICNRTAPKNSDAWKHIELVLKRPKFIDSYNKNDFSSFYGGIQTTVGSFINSISELSQSIEKYRTIIDNIEESINLKEEEKKIAKNEFMSAGGSESNLDINDRQNISDYTFAEKTIDKKRDDIKKAENNIKEWKFKLKRIEEELKVINTNSEIKRFRDFKDLMCCVESIFVNSKERIFDEILKSLEINANQKYSELTQGNKSAGGKLNFSKQADGTVQVSIKNIDDGELTGLGTGFQRMKQLSIIMAIISSKIGNKQFDYPFISDAPFSEFGDNFINNFFKTAPRVFSQSFVFIKDFIKAEEERKHKDDLLNELGLKILSKMNEGEIEGTLYVNMIEDTNDRNNVITSIKCYKG